MLLREREQGPARLLRGLESLDRGIPRAHMAVRADGAVVGEVTSGTFSPTRRVGIGLALLDPRGRGRRGAVDVRGRTSGDARGGAAVRAQPGALSRRRGQPGGCSAMPTSTAAVGDLDEGAEHVAGDAAEPAYGVPAQQAGGERPRPTAASAGRVEAAGAGAGPGGDEGAGRRDRPPRRARRARTVPATSAPSPSADAAGVAGCRRR